MTIFHSIRQRPSLVALTALAAIALLVTPRGTLAPTPAEANGVPTIVQLGYLDGLSNWGPTEATGELELSFAESFARLDASGLPRLAGQLYQGWIVNSETNDAISIGSFNADEAGAIEYAGTLPVITDFGFDLFIITVEPDPDDAPQPAVERSIGGRFSLVGLAEANGQQTGDTQQDGQQQALPAELPNTGDPTLGSDLLRMGLVLAAIALSAFVGLRLGRSRR